MGKTESIDSLMAKYNRLCARYRDLEQQSAEKQDKWEELEREFRTNESLTRELCELILAKDPGEMVLGEEYAWGKLKTRDIIQKSKTAFASYNEARTKLLRDIQRQSEERRVMIENLQAQIESDRRAQARLEELRSQSASDGAPAFDANTGELLAPASPPEPEPFPTEEVPEETKKRMAYKVQQAAKSGSISVLRMGDEDVEDYTPTTPSAASRPPVTAADIQQGGKKPKKQATPHSANDSVTAALHIIEEQSDVTQKGLEQQADMAARAVEVNLERSGAKISQPDKKVREVQSVRTKASQQIVQVNIGSIEKNMNSRRWAILEVMGSTGMCEGSEIISETLALLKERNDSNIVTENGMRHELMQMVSSGCLNMDANVPHPLKSKFSVYAISEVGRALHYAHFGKDPVTSERDMLIAQHDNLEHGFGIKCLKKALEASGTYLNVCMDRRKNTVKLDNGDIYIADITAQIRGRNGLQTIYMEYERGTHHQSDFNIKLNKMVKVTRFVDIVCPNNKTADFLRDKTAAWIESRGGAKSLPNVKIRITTLTRLNGKKNILRDDNWRIVFDLRHGDVPIERQ